MSLRDVLSVAQEKPNKRDTHPLWTLLGPAASSPLVSVSSRLGSTAPAMPALNSKDKTATSLRLLLCDAQSTLEGFSAQVQGLVKDVARASAQMDETTKLVEDHQATANHDLKTLRKSY